MSGREKFSKWLTLSLAVHVFGACLWVWLQSREVVTPGPVQATLVIGPAPATPTSVSVPDPFEPLEPAPARLRAVGDEEAMTAALEQPVIEPVGKTPDEAERDAKSSGSGSTESTITVTSTTPDMTGARLDAQGSDLSADVSASVIPIPKPKVIVFEDAARPVTPDRAADISKEDVKPQPDLATTLSHQGAMPTETDEEARAKTTSAGELNALIRVLHERIESRKRYPAAARLRHREGTATVGFSLDPDGRIDDLNLMHSTGHRRLDEAALLAVRESAPIVEAVTYLRDRQSFQIDIVFSLSGN